jgi:hypothetical protein
MAQKQRSGSNSGQPGIVLSRLPIAVIAVAAVIVAGVAGFLVIVLRSEGEEGPPRAAIIDQLAFNVPNEAFAQEATNLLERAGYMVEYIPTERVTVDFYRDLPSRGYDFILFRTHADRLEATARDGTKFDDVVLFSSEPYDRSKYVPDQAENRLVIAKYQEGGDEYFGIAPTFFESARGGFDGATLVVMGCEGFLTDRTAETFVDRLGATSYISWNETVTAPHTDQATEALLRHLLVEQKSPADAVALTMADLGPDPVYGSRLVAYPRR